MKKALLIIDMQNALSKISNVENVVDEINKEIDLYRENDDKIIFIQHVDNKMPINSYNWELINAINSKKSDAYFTKKYPDSFLNTGLKKYLDKNNIKNIKICGAQTEFCIDTTIKVGFHLGFHITMNKNGYSTFDHEKSPANEINNWYWSIWNKRFININ